MRAYTVHAPPDADDTPERFLFVKDGFSWPALFVPILWILWHRLWLTLVYYIVFILIVAWAGRLLGGNIAAPVAILGSILFALEANNIRRLSLASRGYSDAGSAAGEDLEEAEIRFFEKWRGTGFVAGKGAAMARAAYSPAARADGSDETILGLFPEPER